MNNNKIIFYEVLYYEKAYLSYSVNYDGTFINNATSSHTYLKIKDKYQLSKLGNVYLTDNDVNNILKATF